MPTLPEENSPTKSNGKYDISFNPALPIVHWMTSVGLIDRGFIFAGREWFEKGQGWKTIYKRGMDTVTYDGINWLFNGKKVEFFEDFEPKKEKK